MCFHDIHVHQIYLLSSVHGMNWAEIMIIPIFSWTFVVLHERWSEQSEYFEQEQLHYFCDSIEEKTKKLMNIHDISDP